MSSQARAKGLYFENPEPWSQCARFNVPSISLFFNSFYTLNTSFFTKMRYFLSFQLYYLEVKLKQ